MKINSRKNRWRRRSARKPWSSAAIALGVWDDVMKSYRESLYAKLFIKLQDLLRTEDETL